MCASHTPSLISIVSLQTGHTRADLAQLICNSRATDILKRQRALTLAMIRRIAKEWHVPERLLVREYGVR